MTRPLTGIAAAAQAISIAGALVLLAPASAFSCSCIPLRSPCSIVGSAAVVFVGTPVDVEDAGVHDGTRSVRFRFQIDEAIQNVDLKTADVLTPSDTGVCGFPFEKGRKYLVYASGDGGVYSVSFCSRTGPLEARRDDLELFREAAAGSVRPRLFGTIYRMQLRLDGFYMHHDTLGGIADIPVRVADGDRVLEARTDANGHFSIREISSGMHIVQPQLPRQYVSLFDRENAARVDTCSGQVAIWVTTIPLRGTVQPPNGEALVPKVMLRVAQLDSSGGVAFERSTLAFTESDGSWKFQGLPSGRYVLGVSAFDPPSPHTPYPTTWYPNVARPDAARVFDVTDDGTITVDFHLPVRIPETTFQGTTVAPDGGPVAKVTLSLYDMNGDSRRGAAGYATSDDQGRFSITGLRGRRYRIQGMEIRRGGGTSDMVDVPSDDNREVIVTIKPAKNLP